ncbi:hypothetical protein PS619_01827 [Pseudomonas fluorescens]|nr:hypothetical protein PS619_01827 [Pseudomonas fluorescens]
MNIPNPTLSPVGASLLAKAECHSTLMATDTAPSRAGSLPQKSLQGSYE